MYEQREAKTYEERQIEKQRKEARKNIILLKIALNHIKYKNNRQQKNITHLYEVLSTAKTYAEKQKIKGKLTNALNNMEHSGFISSYDLEKEITKKFEEQRIELEYGKAYEIAYKISKNPIEAAKNYAYLYINCYSMIESCQKQIEESAKHKAEDRKEPYTSAPEYTSTSPRYPYQESTYEKRTTEKKPDLYASKHLSEDEKQKQATEAILTIVEKSTQETYIYYGLTYEQKRELREAYPGVFRYETADAISRAVEMNQIATRMETGNPFSRKGSFAMNSPCDDIISLAIDCYESQVFELLHNNGFGNDYKSQINFSNLMHKLQMGKGIEVYTKAYNKIMKHYQGLSSEEKQSFMSNLDTTQGKKYKEIFFINEKYPRIVTPEEVKNAVNRRIVKEIEKWRMINSSNYHEYYSALNKATRLMSVEELVPLYKKLKNKVMDSYSYAQNDEERRIFEQNRQETLKYLQDCFTSVMRNKIGFKSDLTDAMTEEEKKAELRKIEIQKIAICTDYLKEKPLFSVYYANPSLVKEGEAKTKGDFTTAIQQAQERFYGMGKLKQTIAKATGAYAKLRRLAAKEQVTEQDIEAVKHLF